MKVYQVTTDSKKVNEQNPLWLKQPTEVKEQEYKDFYQTLFPFNPEKLDVVDFIKFSTTIFFALTSSVRNLVNPN